MRCFSELTDCVNSALIGFLSLTDWGWMVLYYMLDFSITADSQFHSASHNITGLFSNIWIHILEEADREGSLKILKNKSSLIYVYNVHVQREAMEIYLREEFLPVWNIFSIMRAVAVSQASSSPLLIIYTSQMEKKGKQHRFYFPYSQKPHQIFFFFFFYQAILESIFYIIRHIIFFYILTNN